MLLKRTLILQTCLCCVFFLGHCADSYATTQDTFNLQKNTGDTIIKRCPKSDQVEKIITEAISIGAPVYNSGYHLACYRIYEWAGYKILYEYGKDCKEVEKILKAAIEKSHGDYSDLEKAWIMRVAFDKIMGVPTQTTDTPKSGDADRKG